MTTLIFSFVIILESYPKSRSQPAELNKDKIKMIAHFMKCLSFIYIRLSPEICKTCFPIRRPSFNRIGNSQDAEMVSLFKQIHFGPGQKRKWFLFSFTSELLRLIIM